MQSFKNKSTILKFAKLKTDEMTNYFRIAINTSKYPDNIPLWEQSSLLKISNFRWIMNNEKICQLNVAAQDKEARVVII